MNSSSSSYLLKNFKKEQQHSQTGHQNFNLHYYEEYQRMHKTTYQLSLQMRELSKQKQMLWQKLSKLQQKTLQFQDIIRPQAQKQIKRERRIAEEIQRTYVCQVEICQKSYGTKGSLQQHIKLKHPELFNSQEQSKQ